MSDAVQVLEADALGGKSGKVRVAISQGEISAVKDQLML
jgi:hypothetical protein